MNLYKSKPYWIEDKEILSSIICFEYIFKNHIRKNQIDLINVLYNLIIFCNIFDFIIDLNNKIFNNLIYFLYASNRVIINFF